MQPLHRTALQPYKILAYLLYNPELDRPGNCVVVEYQQLVDLTGSHHQYIKPYLEKLRDAGLINSLTLRKKYAIMQLATPIGYELSNGRLQTNQASDDGESQIPPSDEAAGGAGDCSDEPS